MKSISKRIIYQVSVSDMNNYIDYKVSVNNVLVYTGKSYPIPGSYTCLLNVGDIVADYINYETIINTNYFTHNAAAQDQSGNICFLSIEYKESDISLWAMLNITDPYIHYSWLNGYYSYDYSTDGILLQTKNNYKVTRNCIVKCEGLNTTGATANGFLAQPNTYAQSVYQINPYSTKSYTLSPLVYPNADKITFNYKGIEIVFNILENCNNKYIGCLYFINRYGGLEPLLINNTSKKTAVSTRSNYTKGIYNYSDYTLDTTDFENKVYNNDIKYSWALNTNILTNEDAYWIEQLYTSPYVWFQEFDTNIINSVIITDTNSDFKKFFNNNNKIPSYTINIEYSQKNIRK